MTTTENDTPAGSTQRPTHRPTGAADRALDAAESWRIGRVSVTKFVEMAVAIPGEMMLPEATAGVVLDRGDELGPYATDEGWLTFGVHGFVLDDGERRILVDGGIGNAKPRPDQPWFDHLDTPVLATMAAAGYPVGSIDTVVATHLHVDHVGWFTIAGHGAEPWVPTFPTARHLVVRDELAHWQAVPDDQRTGTHLTDSVEPVLAAALIDEVAADHAITDEIRLLATPGHSPGHVSVLIASGGASAVITGDLLHHPIQVLEPGWDGPFDDDTVLSAATRRAFLGRFADTDTLVLGTHVPTPTAGRIVSTPGGWRWDPVPN